MDKKLIQVGLMGMNKDVINSKTAQQQAYEIKNFRLSATQDSNAFELTTERGIKSIPLEWTDSNNHTIQVQGTIIGCCVLNDYLVLFTTDHEELDMIYRLTLNSNESDEVVTEIIQLYEGVHLGFRLNNLIDAIPYYETELIQKVYWIDGINQPRVINIANMENSNLPKQHLGDVNYDPYGFVQEIYGDYNPIQVTKGYVGGMFHAGVIQYAYSFFNENAQETPVIDVTPLYYIAHEDRGEKPDTRVGCTFTLTLNVPIDFHDKFDYIRFYSIYRSALDTTPLVKVINEVETSKLTQVGSGGQIDHYELSFIDDNTQGYVYDAQQLLIRNNKIIPQTFNYKDGKLFFGNFKNDLYITDITSKFENVQWNISWQGRELEIQEADKRSIYNHKNQLQKNSKQIKGFKGGEFYKLGIQLQDKYGNWSQPIPIGTFQNDFYPEGWNNTDYRYDKYSIPYAESNLTIGDIIQILDNESSNYVRVRTIVSFPKDNERTLLCQGIINPTVFNLGQRYNGTCYAQSSWFFRPVFPNVNVNNFGQIDSNTKIGLGYAITKHNEPLGNSNWINGELQNMYSDSIYNTQGPVIEYAPTQYDLKEEYNNLHTSQTLFNSLTEFEVLGLSILKFQRDFTSDLSQSYTDPSYIDPYNGATLQPNFEYFINVGTESNPKYNETLSFYSECYYGVVFHGENSQLYSEELDYGINYVLSIIKIIRYYDQLNNTYVYKYSNKEVQEYYVSQDSNYYYKPIQGMMGHSSTYYSGRRRISAHNLIDEDKEKYLSYYYTDNQVCTFNSPEIDQSSSIQNVDLTNYTLSINGIARFSSNVGQYNIVAENPQFLNDVDISGGSDKQDWIRGTTLAAGFYKKQFNTLGSDPYQASHGGSVVSALNCWFDDVCNIFTWDSKVKLWNEQSIMRSFVAYPWQRKYLNNFNNNQYLRENPSQDDNDSGITTENETSVIIKKVLSNLRISYTDYFDYKDIPVEQLKLFNSEEPQILKLSNNGDKFYSGNVDQLITCTSKYIGPFFNYREGAYNIHWDTGEVQGYPLVIGQSKPFGSIEESLGKPWEYRLKGSIIQDYDQHDTPNNRSTDSIWIRYKSSPHIVFKLAENKTLPILNSNYSINKFGGYNGGVIWEPSSIEIEQSEDLDVDNDTRQSYLFVADIKRKYSNSEAYFNLDNTFDNLNRIWLPCDRSYALHEQNEDKTLTWIEGDTFFQRYDCLKTYPFSNDDYQSVVEIGSFMLETRVNLDGRYDTNRGLMDNTAVTKENFNLINPVYSQMNNFFQYKILDERFNNKETEYKNRITWTLDKQNGDDVDQWTRVTELGILDLDGDKGKVTKIERFDNNLYIFQDKGIARLNYNDNIQIPTEGNIPIEVVNSGFINGKRYISENQGLQDKWCSKSTPYGIFFKDGYSKALCTVKYDERRNPVVAPLSQGAMQKWTEQNINDIYMVNYDNQVNEALFMIQNNADYSSLSYSPLYQAFTAFYDYKDWIGNYNNSTISLLNSSISSQNIYFLRRAADSNNEPIFNYFYDELKPYWIKWTSVVDNYDCIFDNIYLKSNIYEQSRNSMNDEDVDNTFKGYDIYQENPTVPFDLIAVSNDKQAYELENTFANVWKEFKPIKKFGVWRGRIPRINSINGKYLGSRIRNHWTRIGLKKENPSTEKTVVRDIKVDAFF